MKIPANRKLLILSTRQRGGGGDNSRLYRSWTFFDGNLSSFNYDYILKP